MKTKNENQFVISVERGKFFRCIMSLDRRQYRKINERKWHHLSMGCAIYRNPGMYEIWIGDKKELEKALLRYEAEVQEAKKTEMLYRVEGKYPMRCWIAGDTSEHRRKGGKKNNEKVS